MMIRKILCAIDRSPSSLQAFGYAIALARWQSARLTLLEVAEEAPPPGVSRAPTSDGVPNETRIALERDLRRVLTARRASDVKVEIVIRKGKVVQEILAQAKASRSDLVVIGSHGRGGVQRLVLGSVARARSGDLIVMGVSGRGALDVALLGSTTHHVIREGAWPVLTVRTVKR